MSWLKYVPLSNPTKPDPQTTEWMAQARTPETRARIRRWSRLNTAGTVLTVGGVHAMTAAFATTIAVAAWFSMADIDRIDVYFWLWIPTLVIFICGIGLVAVADSRLLTAAFADGHVSVGRIDEVITHPDRRDDLTSYEFVISANVRGKAPIHRRLDWVDSDDPTSWVGRAIRFRHNTLDPQNAHDVRYEGFPDRDADGAGA